jgi:hypothetical protein
MQPNTIEPTNESELNPKQEIAIAALISRNTIKDAAAAANVSEVTLWRWMKQPAFKRAYTEARWRAVQQAIAILQNATSTAAIVLHKVAEDEDADPRVRVYASRAILHNAMKGIELEDQEQRLNELEALAKEHNEKEATK